MKLRFFLLSLILLANFASADDRWRTIKTSVIEDSMCIPLLDGTGYLHVDEDVSGLIIQVVGVDGTSVALYDAATEIEDIAVLGTYATPSANNVRVSPDALTGGDCTQMMFADAVYSGENWIQIRVTDGQTTIMDFTRWVYLDLITTQDFGLLLGPLAITTVTDQTHLILPSGPSNADAYDNTWAFIEGGTEQCIVQITDYAVGPPTVTLRAACPFTVAATTDTIEIHAGASGDALTVVDSVADSNASAIAGLNDITARSVWAVDATDEQTLGTFGYLHGDPVAGTCDSGSTTTCVDAAAFTTADADYYAKGFAIMFTSGTLDKQSACIYDFDPATDKVTFRPALTQAVSTHTYILLAAPTCGGVIAP